MRYKWVEGSKISLDAQVIGKELESLRKQNDGKLTKEIVVAVARSKNSPLHDAFEWDDDKAAEQYRLQQAGYIIRSVAVVFENPDTDEDTEIRAFVSVIQDEDEKPSYTSLSVAVQDEDLRKQVFENALRDLNAWKKKYAYLKIFDRVFNEIEQINELAKQNHKVTTIKVNR